jgi:lysozyme
MSSILQLVKHFESLHDGNLKEIGLQPKLCPAGFWTIGYGHVIINPVNNRPFTHTSTANDVKPYLLKNEAEALALLDIDFTKFKSHVLANVNKNINPLPREIHSMASFAYNVGVGNFTKSTLLRLFNKGDRAGASLEFMKWCKARNPKTGEMIVLKGLERRRKSEQHYFLTGEFKAV